MQCKQTTHPVLNNVDKTRYVQTTEASFHAWMGLTNFLPNPYTLKSAKNASLGRL